MKVGWKKSRRATFSGAQPGPFREAPLGGNGGDDLGKHFIAFDTMVKNAQGSDSKKCNW